MTTVAFTPSPLQPFQFQATLDGQQYTVIVTWNIFGQRWYINIYSLNGVLVAVLPLIGSAVTLQLASLMWNQLAGIMVATTMLPLPFKIGQVVNLSLANIVPVALNGRVQCNITGLKTFTFPMPGDPGRITTVGVVDYGINLVAGYFVDSTMVYREPNTQFEINP